MSSGSTGSFWIPGGGGRKEDKTRAELVYKRLMSASAMTTDLDSELNELKFWLDLEGSNYQPQDLKAFRAPLDKAIELLESIYRDVSEFSGRPTPERLTEMEAYQAVQPALRIENKAYELKQLLVKAREAKDKVDLPRANASTVLEAAERKRLQVETGLADARRKVNEMQAGKAENYPEASAAFTTAEREIFAGTQLLQGAQEKILRKSFREAMDAAERSIKILESGEGRFIYIKQAYDKYNSTALNADETLEKALKRLQEAKDILTARAALLSGQPNTYLQSAVQRIGEARRAYKATPPQFMTTHRLASEALTLIEEALTRANEETRFLRDSRMNARQLSQQLKDTVLEARSLINSRQSVPVRANELYLQARNERDRLLQQDVDDLKLTELTQLCASLQTALKLAQDALKLLN